MSKKAQAKADAKIKDIAEIMPLTREGFGVAEHKYNSFHAEVPDGMDLDSLKNPALWRNVSRDVTVNDEIRVLNSSGTLYALLLVTYKVGTDIGLTPIIFKEMSQEETPLIPKSPWSVVSVARGKWSVIINETGEEIFSNLPTQSAAYRQLEDHQKVLAS